MKHFPFIKSIDNRKNVPNTQNINNLEMWLGIYEGKIPHGHSFENCKNFLGAVYTQKYCSSGIYSAGLSREPDAVMSTWFISM